MAEKHLTEAAWKSFAKGKDYKDAALLKALDAWSRAAKGPPQAQLDAIGLIDKEAEALKKANKADKELAAYLLDLGKALERERKDVQAAAKAQADEEEEEESPALLTSKLVPLVRQVRKGDAMHALIATTGKATAVMLARRAISPARRKLLAEFLDASAGAKYIVGQCIWEEEAHTFVVQTQATGLAKKLKAALLAQTQLRLKVRVRGEDPALVDEDLDDADLAAPGASEAATGGAQTEDNAAQLLAFNARLKAMLPQVQAAMASGHAQAGDLKLKVGEAGTLARQNRFDQGRALLDEIDRLLAQAAPAVAPPIQPGRFVNQAKARIAWQGMRQKVQVDLKKLEDAILAHYQGATNFGELTAKVRKLDKVLSALDETLADTLDDALNASDLAQRARLHEQARGILARYTEFATADELMLALDSNPFVPLTTRDTLLKGLQVLDKSLA